MAGIKTDLTQKELRKQFSAEHLKQTPPEDVRPEFGKAQQAWTGVLGWAAKTQPHLSVVFSEISKNSTKPSAQSVLNAKRACEYAKATHKRLVLEGVARPAIVWWVDASYSIRSCDGRVGWEVQVVDEKTINDKIYMIQESNLVAWRSRRCDRKLASTTSGELVALQEGVKAVPAYTRLVEAVWGVKPRVVFVTDSQPLLGWLRKGWVDTDPHLQGVLDFVKGRLDEMGSEVLWVESEQQRADRHTKFIRVRG